jgi:glycosyltransferase involved in cell wall biosynthesis
VCADNKPTVLIYADILLPPTQTFVLAQGEALEGFTPFYIGVRRLGTGSLPMPSERTLTLNGVGGMWGKIKEIPYRRFGYAPIYFRQVRKRHPRLLHAHFGTCGLKALSLAEWLGIPVITTFHGFDATIRDSFLEKSAYGLREYVRRKHVLKERGRLFIAVSRFIKSKILEQGFAEEKMVVHYVGVDTDFFRADPGVKREPVILFTGGLNEVKGCEFLIRAMARVQSRMPETELVVIGDGPLRHELEKLARETLTRFRFLGVQPKAVVKEWMNRAKVFSVPSVTAESGAEEGFGLVFAEAQAMGCPVVSFTSGGIPEAVADGETGLLAKEREVETLAEYIFRLMKDHSMWRRMSEAGRDRARVLFDLRTQTKSLEELYRQVLRSPSPGFNLQTTSLAVRNVG